MSLTKENGVAINPSRRFRAGSDGGVAAPPLGRRGMKLSRPQRRALRKIKRREFCARWLIHPNTSKSLIARGLVCECGFYSLEIVK